VAAFGEKNLSLGLKILQPHAVSLHLVVYKPDGNGTHFILGKEGVKLGKSETRTERENDDIGGGTRRQQEASNGAHALKQKKT